MALVAMANITSDYCHKKFFRAIKCSRALLVFWPARFMVPSHRRSFHHQLPMAGKLRFSLRPCGRGDGTGGTP